MDRKGDGDWKRGDDVDDDADHDEDICNDDDDEVNVYDQVIAPLIIVWFILRNVNARVTIRQQCRLSVCCY